MPELIHRRGLLLGISSLFVAPAIVRASSLMPVKTMIWDDRIPVKVIDFMGHDLFDTYATKRPSGLWEVWDSPLQAFRSVWLPDHCTPRPGCSLMSLDRT